MLELTQSHMTLNYLKRNKLKVDSASQLELDFQGFDNDEQQRRKLFDARQERQFKDIPRGKKGKGKKENESSVYDRMLYIIKN